MSDAGGLSRSSGLHKHCTPLAARLPLPCALATSPHITIALHLSALSVRVRCLRACRYAAVYRLLGSVLIIVVARCHANVFSCLNLASAISRLLVAESKSVDVSPQRLLKKYAQVRARNAGHVMRRVPAPLRHDGRTRGSCRRLLCTRRLHAAARGLSRSHARLPSGAAASPGVSVN